MHHSQVDSQTANIVRTYVGKSNYKTAVFNIENERGEFLHRPEGHPSKTENFFSLQQLKNPKESEALPGQTQKLPRGNWDDAHACPIIEGVTTLKIVLYSRNMKAAGEPAVCCSIGKELYPMHLRTIPYYSILAARKEYPITDSFG